MKLFPQIFRVVGIAEKVPYVFFYWNPKEFFLFNL
jgi:hypothetical protein